MDFKNLSVQLRKLHEMDTPEDLLELRKAIYHEELGDIPLDSILEQDDEKSIHIYIYCCTVLMNWQALFDYCQLLTLSTFRMSVK